MVLRQSDIMASRDTATNVGFHQREHDILSLLSIFVRSHHTVTQSLLLIGVLLSEEFNLPPPINEGSYFEVYGIHCKRITEKPSSRVDSKLPGEPFPEVVAVKCPKITGSLRDRRNQKLWSSMAMELQILQNQHIRDHENIVNILGVCWRSVRGQIMPAFVMELANTNLQIMIETQNFGVDSISTRKIFGLAVDVCAGVTALHEVGIIHGDIKPANILIFRHPELQFIAKISDFGSSLLKTDVEKPIHLPFSSGVWQAPECKTALDGEQLIAADTFSLALVVGNMLSRGLMIAMLDDDGFNRLAEPYGPSILSQNDMDKRYNIAARCAYITVTSMLRDALKLEEKNRYKPTAAQQSEGTTSSPEEDDEVDDDTENDSEYKRIDQIAQSTGEAIVPHLFQPSLRPSSRVIHRNLRVCLAWIIRRDMLNPLNYSDPERMIDFIKATENNAQEFEILQNPVDEAPSEEDTARVWRYAKMTDYIDRSVYAISQQKDLPDFDSIPQAEAAHKVSRILDSWKKHELPKPVEMYRIRDAGAVVEADRSLGTLRILPQPVLKQIVTEMLAVAHNEQEDKLRRAEAAWQCSMLQFRMKQIEKGKEDELDSILQLMLLAARLGHTEAGGMIGWLYAAFEQPFPVPKEEEIPWLYAAVCKGGSTSRRRLLSFDIGQYEQAVSHLRFRYAGIGLRAPRNYYDSDLVHDDDFLEAIEDSRAFTADVFQLAATGGRYELVRRIIASQPLGLNINEVSAGNECALLKACRSGHAQIALCLLENGANPTIANEEGITPLHFLSSFDDDDIPNITDALISAGADREARTNHAGRYMECIDSTYGIIDGTPLAWAVAADNEAATQALIDVGADPFDVKGRDIKYEDGWSNSVHVFPVWQASVNCQHRLLEILLKFSKDCAEHLNSAYRTFGNGFKEPFSILGWMVTGGTPSTANRIFIHGKDFAKAFQTTFDILVRYGANPLDVTGNGDNVMGPALGWSQPYVLDYLMGWRNGKLQPDPLQWMGGLWTACLYGDEVTENWLIHYSQADKVPPEQLDAFFAAAYALPDDPELLSRLAQYQHERADANAYFETALVAGNYDLARSVYAMGKCDLTKITDGTTIFGRLIISSKAYSNSSRHIDVLLDMDIPDSVYYNVFELEGSMMSALHAAVYLTEYRPGSSFSMSSLQSIVRRKYDPEYLNLVITEGKYKGNSAIHLAVRTCNEEAVRYLLDEEGDDLELGLADGEGYSLIDRASLLLKNQAPQMEFWELPEEQRKDADQRHFEKTLIILHMLYGTKLVRPRRMLASVTKIEVDELFMLLYEAEKFQITKIDIKMLLNLTSEQLVRVGIWYSAQTSWDLTMIWPQVVEHGPKLSLNSSFFLFKTDEMSAEEIETTSSMGQVVRRQQPVGEAEGEPVAAGDLVRGLEVQMRAMTTVGAESAGPRDA
ncbi:serine threonine kinase [Pyrenophora seminiperda CCB06]|uniref:Serine threonine kinase n=1 Tax=Pyrenophora seminiperda CCB06 TaxID=1302712 RepID=A0A3M7M4A9_9PLEO|nr:serine threonine kinase [Pyrenophora seminiperda CCB06]